MSEKICCWIPPWFPARRAGALATPAQEAGRAINLGLTRYRSGRPLLALEPINSLRSPLRRPPTLGRIFPPGVGTGFQCSPLRRVAVWFCLCHALTRFLSFPSIHHSVYCTRPSVSLYRSSYLSSCLSTAQQWVTSGGEVGGLPGIKAPSEALPVWHVDPVPCSHSPGPTLQ